MFALDAPLLLHSCVEAATDGQRSGGKRPPDGEPDLEGEDDDAGLALGCLDDDDDEDGGGGGDMDDDL